MAAIICTFLFGYWMFKRKNSPAEQKSRIDPIGGDDMDEFHNFTEPYKLGLPRTPFKPYWQDTQDEISRDVIANKPVIDRVTSSAFMARFQDAQRHSELDFNNYGIGGQASMLSRHYNYYHNPSPMHILRNVH